MSEPSPDPGDAFKVENRSDRVWVFGYFRMAPLLIFLTGVGLLCLLGNRIGPIHPAAGLGSLLVFFVLPLYLNYSSVIDPVNYLVFGPGLHVQRLAGKQQWVVTRLRRVEFSEAGGEDYDEARRPRRQWWVTVRLRRAWPAPRLLVSDVGARRIADWATSHQIPVTGRPD